MGNEFQNKRVKRIVKSTLSFILIPLAFAALGSFLFFVALEPIVSPYLGVMKMAFAQEPPVFDRELVDIYKDKMIEDLPSENKAIAVSYKDIPAFEERYGQIICETVQIDSPLYYGDSQKVLNEGVGTYSGAGIPGAGTTILLAGHSISDFANLGKLEVGDQIKINTSYGQYVYEMVDSKIALSTDETAYDLTKQEENLIMYTCYPFNAIIGPERYFVYAKYVSGPMLDFSNFY